MNRWVRSASAFAIADMKAFVRDRQAMFWTFFFPIMFMVLLGLVFGNAQVIDLKIGVIDQDQSAASASLVAQVDALDHVTVVPYTGDIGQANATARKALDKGEVAVYIIIPQGYGAAIDARKNGSANNSTPPTPIPVFFALDNTGNGRVALTVLSQVIGQVNDAALDSHAVVVPAPQEVTVTRGRYIDYLVPGILGMTMMFNGVFSLATVMTSMRQKGVLRRLKVTPVAKSAILAAMILTRMFILFISMGLILAIGIFGFGVQIQGNPALLVGIIVLGALSFTTFGFAVSAYARTVESAEALANVITMPMMFLGDVFLPVALMPSYIQPFAKALPLRYLTDALRQVAIDGGGIFDVVVSLGAVIGWGLVGFVIAVRLFKWE
jgi:ABC-2 type transport system permease protein